MQAKSEHNRTGTVLAVWGTASLRRTEVAKLL
jgi:hypothetical protein